MSDPLYTIASLPLKGGRGLLASIPISPGTRILTEVPLLIVPGRSTHKKSLVEAHLHQLIDALPAPSRAAFLLLANNFPKPYPLIGILRTNNLPAGPHPTTAEPQGAIYLTMSATNHSCAPNAEYQWNSALAACTLHATRAIAAADEITIRYCKPEPFAARQAFLRRHFGFACACPLCALAPTDRAASDSRLSMMDALKVLRPAEPLQALGNQWTRLQLGHKEETSGGWAGDVWCEGFRITASNGDEGRAREFARRYWEAEVLCRGEDSPEVGHVAAWAASPKSWMGWGEGIWKDEPDTMPEGLEGEELEQWLWRK